tara:strand:- start:2090 stop:2872 length:783 start_codon:yes stop_codon:yes gene_type:complete
MKTTLIISTYNWSNALELVLKSVLFQTFTVDEVIIADDGSSEETKSLINTYSNLFSIPLKHVWHPDLGFRKTIILNKAYSCAIGEYIIQIDGDIILHPKFIQDHITNARKSQFIHGGRVLLKLNITLERLNNLNINFHFFNKGLSNRLNTIYSPFLSNFFKSQSRSLKKTRGCNFSCWKEDFDKVNGYNQDMIGWGFEDSELSARLINNNILKKRLKFIGLTYHLYHPININANSIINKKILNHTLNKKVKCCKNGLKRL